ncbi:hypothetical protein [Methylovulum sp.]|uniref:hypothetical protein n=1 Tax=Methylovulum sp. TaxID=1916980 RepID=UPI002604A9C4|nr:hypothetical protein [Methylovulum sp.]MDD5123256.1 hypothetical protein [Methylovulum sp.]
MSEKEEPLVIQKGDVLINGTGVGTIGRSACYLHEQNALPDNHVTILRTDKINPIFLSVYLNSIAGKYQVDKYFKGSSGQIEIYPKDIENFGSPAIGMICKKSSLPIYWLECPYFKAYSHRNIFLTNLLSFRLQDYRKLYCRCLRTHCSWPFPNLALAIRYNHYFAF